MTTLIGDAKPLNCLEEYPRRKGFWSYAPIAAVTSCTNSWFPLAQIERWNQGLDLELLRLAARGGIERQFTLVPPRLDHKTLLNRYLTQGATKTDALVLLDKSVQRGRLDAAEATRLMDACRLAG